MLALKKKDELTLLMRDGQLEVEVKTCPKEKKFEENLADLEVIVQKAGKW